MSDGERYIGKRKVRSTKSAQDFEAGYGAFELGVIFRQARARAGLTQAAIARRLRTKKSVISRIEHHAELVPLSTLEKYARALGMKLKVQLSD